MKSIAEYANELHALVKKVQDEMTEIRADGVLEYEEVVEGKKFYINYQNGLKNLKKEVGLDIRQIRNHYKGEILKAKSDLSGKEQTEQVEILQLEQHKATAPFEQVVQTIDRLLLTAAHDKQRLDRVSDEMKRMDLVALSIDPLGKVTASPKQDTPAAPTSEQDTLDSDELSELLKKWKFLLDDVSKKLEDQNQDPLYISQLKGAKKAFEMVIWDISQIVEE